jgi:hypothetical protein
VKSRKLGVNTAMSTVVNKVPRNKTKTQFLSSEHEVVSIRTKENSSLLTPMSFNVQRGTVPGIQAKAQGLML